MCSWINAIIEVKRILIRSNLNGKASPFHPYSGHITKSTEEKMPVKIGMSKKNTVITKAQLDKQKQDTNIAVPEETTNASTAD